MPDTGDSEQDTIITFNSRRGKLHVIGFNSFFFFFPNCLWENWSLMSPLASVVSDSISNPNPFP